MNKEDLVKDLLNKLLVIEKQIYNLLTLFYRCEREDKRNSDLWASAIDSIRDKFKEEENFINSINENVIFGKELSKVVIR